jgi:SAM-dependent methyltransferase
VKDHYYKTVPGYFDFPQVYREAVAFMPNGGTFVEVGSWQGQSLSYLLVEALNSGKRFKVFGCDHFRGSVGDRPLLSEAKIKSVVAHCAHNLRPAGYPFALIHADSEVGATFFADASIDYLFVDAGHQYEEVRSDLSAWVRKVRPGGIIAGHDFNNPDVERAVREVFSEVEHINENSPEWANGFQWGTCWRVQL